ncbi:tryptophan--tRNA ligase, mitochondrial-like [Tubulanus polymorphus]|uniref:tryptophan--tRNA ligase, mitochondrial-like n=1 Tax=Tubulanus polymorphus TaxID=672921 RepID=UPI003DA2ACDA
MERFLSFRAMKCGIFLNLNIISKRLYTQIPSKKVKFAAPASVQIFSGIQPTGVPHIGNYLGAVANWVRLQQLEQSNVIYSIVDLHAITIPIKPSLLRKQIHDMVIALIACGIDPDQSILFQQSTVSEHTELGWILSCLCTMPRIEHLPQWKEKAAQQKEVGLGLFTYPVLQAADILLYKATDVPVGDDQLKHIELAGHLAKLFNNQYGITFPKPKPIVNEATRIKSLRKVANKMSKSEPDEKSRINLDDSADVIVEKLKKAVTDNISQVYYDPDSRPGVSNLIDIHSAFSGLSHEQISKDYAHLDTGKYKPLVAEIVIEFLKPIQNEMNRLRTDPGHIEKVLKIGSEKARHIAYKNMQEIKNKVGLS